MTVILENHLLCPDSNKWTQKVIFQDDGHILRTASTAVLVAIDPDDNNGKKQANLFVTGPLAKGVVVSRIDLLSLTCLSLKSRLVSFQPVFKDTR
jgi:hypothetical protein